MPGDSRFLRHGAINNRDGRPGLLSAKLSNGDYLIKGKNVTGFSWGEEVLAKREKAVPFNPEEEMQKRGTNYTEAKTPFETYIVEDGLLIAVGERV